MKPIAILFPVATVVAGFVGALVSLSLAPAPAETPPVPTESLSLERRIHALASRLDSLEASTLPPATPRPESAAAPRPESAADVVPEVSPAEPGGLDERVLAGRATAEEETRYWERMRESDRLPQLIAELERRVGEEGDIPSRLALARACVTKLYTVPNGPERGAWAEKAEAQWRAVLEQDDRSWEARFGLARSLASWPPAFGKGPEAVRHLEALKEQQRSLPAEPHHVDVYLQLASLDRRRGESGKAEEVLREGLARHPEDERLRAALDR